MANSIHLEKTEIALFPIPNIIAFPNATIPLHVFEPRYRQMIKDSIEMNRRIGVCHVEKIIREAPQDQPLEAILSSNQSTYKPQNIFSAGFCKITETLDDQRLKVEIQMDHRYQLAETIQELPYPIYNCIKYQDDFLTEDSKTQKANTHKRNTIDNYLTKLATDNEDSQFSQLLQSKEWKQQETEEYCYSLFQMIQFPAETSQKALEMTSTLNRLNFAMQLLSL